MSKLKLDLHPIFNQSKALDGGRDVRELFKPEGRS